jgi:predicted enzyme related to lactoylglutathione lyase
MKRVTGIGGIFFKARDPEGLREWYRKHLEIDIQSWGGTAFLWADEGPEAANGITVWTIFPSTTDYFDPSPAPFMVNYRVPDLMGLLDTLRSEGCNVVDKTDVSEFGKFGWVIDPEGNRLELWEPPKGKFPG